MKGHKTNIAVITADMVNFTHFHNEVATSWLTELIEILTADPEFAWVLPPEIYRGDSFQAVLRNHEEVMRFAILSRAILKSKNPDADLRIAIGIGDADQITDRPGTSDGEAFRLSGHLADNIRNQRARIGIALKRPSDPLNANMALLEALIENWTPAQSEVIAKLIQGNNISRIAENLSISQSAVSQRVAAAKWWAIDSFLSTFPKQIELYTNSEPS